MGWLDDIWDVAGSIKNKAGDAVMNASGTTPAMTPEAQAAADAKRAMDDRANAFQYGGRPGAAAADMDRYRNMGRAWSGLQSPGNDYGQANGYAGMGDQARGSQQDALGMMRDAAMGNAPSVAQLQQQRGMQDAMSSQLALAAGARGASGLAQAGYNAAGNVAALQRGGAMDASMLRANEMANARGAYGQMGTAMRGQDLGFYGQASNNAQSNGQLGLGYRQLGLQGQLGFENLGQGVAGSQMNGQMGLYGANDANFNAQQARNNQSQANANQNYATGAGMVNSFLKKADQS